MKTELKITFMRIAFLFALFAAAYFVAGCTSPKKVRDIELKGMYVNGYSEVVAIGQGRLTSIPGEREALAAHYEEDTAWLSPSTKTHKFDIFLVGTTSSSSARTRWRTRRGSSTPSARRSRTSRRRSRRHTRQTPAARRHST